MKKKTIFMLKMNSSAVFNSHFFVFRDMKPLFSVTESIDQSDTNAPTVF